VNFVAGVFVVCIAVLWSAVASFSAPYTNGLLNGVVLSYRYHRTNGMDRIQVRSGTGATVTNDYSFDGYGRIASVSNGGYSANYAYLANSDLLHTTTSKAGTAPILTATRLWEHGAR
jgi:hypothetical protein